MNLTYAAHRNKIKNSFLSSFECFEEPVNEEITKNYEKIVKNECQSSKITNKK